MLFSSNKEKIKLQISAIPHTVAQIKKILNDTTFAVLGGPASHFGNHCSNVPHTGHIHPKLRTAVLEHQAGEKVLLQ